MTVTERTGRAAPFAPTVGQFARHVARADAKGTLGPLAGVSDAVVCFAEIAVGQGANDVGGHYQLRLGLDSCGCFSLDVRINSLCETLRDTVSHPP